MWSRMEALCPLAMVLLALLNNDVIAVQCPHEESGLLKWSDLSTWTGGSKPERGDQVTLTAGMKVLLDESSQELGSLTIESDAKLVWADKDDIRLTASYVLVHGEFHMGSDDCRLERRANIVLTGLSNSSLVVPGFGRKFIGVGVNGTIELHGRDKLSWTKLAMSVQPADHTCGVVYDHQSSINKKESAAGLHVMVWNLDGTVYDFVPFVTGESWSSDYSFTAFVDYLGKIPADKVVGIAVQRKMGSEIKADKDWAAIYTAVESLGGISNSHIRKVADNEAYAFITVTGSPEYTMEQHQPLADNAEYTITDNVHITLWDKKLKFFVESAVRTTNNWRHKHAVDFRSVSTDVAYPKIEVIDDVTSWKAGERVVFTSSDFDWRQAEEFTIFPCTDCAENQFRVDGEFNFPHYGKIYDGVDMRAEVAVLSRDIVIEGRMEDSCYVTERNPEKEAWLCELFDFDHFGGHFKIVQGFKSAHIQGIEFYHMGQQEFKGSYPIHFHMCDDVTGSWVRSNSIHHTLARCLTIHGTDGVEVSDNVCYDHLGHGYFFEDGVEQHNILDGNIGIGTKHGTHIMTDMKSNWCDASIKGSCDAVSTFWITHFNNHIRNNVAAGSDNAAFWMITADRPLGPSLARQKQKAERGEPSVTEFSARSTPILEFYNNVGHSSKRGLMLENRISNGETHHNKFIPENGHIGGNRYLPRVNGTPDGEITTTSIVKLTVYRNKQDNIWMRAANTILVNCSIADSQTGLTMLKSTGDTYNEVKNSVFIGMSDNMGTGLTYTKWTDDKQNKLQHTFERSYLGWRPTDPVSGYVFYTGPNYVTDCYFNKFNHWIWNSTWEDMYNTPGYHTGSAITFKRGGMLIFTPQSEVSGIKFGFCDGVDGNGVYDGNNTVPGFERDGENKVLATFHDVDGSVTGVSDTQVVKNHPFFTTPRCAFRNNWEMSACPNKYARIIVHSHIMNVGSTERPIVFVRDDAHEHPFLLEKGQGNSYHMMLNKTYTVHFPMTVPTTIRLMALNMEAGDFFRFGLCMPKDMTSFELTSWYPSMNRWSPPVEVDTIEKLDADTSAMAYFWDKEVGMVFVKMMSNETRADRRTCPNGKCPNFHIKRLDGSNTADCSSTAYGPYVKSPESATEEMAPPTCNKASSDGHGAGASRPTAVAPTLTGQITCVAPDTPPLEPLSQQSRGCAVDNWMRDIDGSYDLLYGSLTPGICVRKCTNRNFRYAAVQYGRDCWCGNSFGVNGGGGDCTKECNGNKALTCGGSWRNQVYTTGLVAETPLVRCGPNSRGFVLGETGLCYLLQEDKKNFFDAQRACVKMGGDLASIPSLETQVAIRATIGQGKSHVWIGLTDAANEGEFVFMDGTPVTYHGGELVAEPKHTWKNFYSMDYNRKYGWVGHSERDQYRYLCQLPLDPATTAVETCGPNAAGHRMGSGGKCFSVINSRTERDTAEYHCLTMQGVLATYTDEVSQREIRNQLFMFGIDGVDYWTGDASSSKLTRNSLYHKTVAEEGEKNGFICLLEQPTTLSSSCPPQWQEHGVSCYLYTGQTVPHMESASALCNQGQSTMVTVHSKEENDFVYNMVKQFHDGQAKDVLLGIRYLSSTDLFSWVDGSSSDYKNWAAGHGMTGLTNGHCAKITYTAGGDMIWKNTPCVDTDHAVVCKMTVMSS